MGQFLGDVWIEESDETYNLDRNSSMFACVCVASAKHFLGRTLLSLSLTITFIMLRPRKHRYYMITLKVFTYLRSSHDRPKGKNDNMQ